jgi:hypothetical protein
MSSHKAPFTAHFRVIATRGKRFETIRSLQRLAGLIYAGASGTDGLIGEASIQVATPGGGQASQLNASDQTDYYPGCAYTPQFGETPAQLTITGFYLLDTANDQPWSDKTVAFSGDYSTGAGGAQGYRTNPTTAVASEVQALKAIIDAVIAAEVPNESVTLFRLDYKGIIWGDRGFHFPR